MDRLVSRRLPPHQAANAISQAVARLRAHGAPFVDLTESNPTHAGIAYPPDLLTSLGDAAALDYRPEPLGLRAAREAVAGEFRRRGRHVDPDHLLLSASSSEAYSWLFKLLCDPGDAVLVPQPSYPLFEHLTRLEGIEAVPYRLEYHGRWEIDVDALDAAPASARAVLAVSPNNPTGTFLSRREVGQLTAWCRRRGAALIVDEVFADYPLEAVDPPTDLACEAEVLTFTLGGASKALGLPQIKLGWTLVGGPARERQEALAALELIADTYLSVSTPVQMAAPALLRDAAPVRAAIHERVRANLRRLRAAVARHPACTLLPVDGGWSAVLRVPATHGEDALVLRLLDEERVLVHPGFFFDLPHEAFLVISLLPEPETFIPAIERVLVRSNC